MRTVFRKMARIALLGENMAVFVRFTADTYLIGWNILLVVRIIEF